MNPWDSEKKRLSEVERKQDWEKRRTQLKNEARKVLIKKADKSQCSKSKYYGW